ncbi:polysaccharide biosynthesis protein [Robiginitomaculum antarcticum]|uniref:polysaccharide biosynthesis protein n=1 Tax=Robiginitomaculum antarcticum TaxID=437507 RepID=UPI000366CC55|nr:polysaccharide biosynthesis protein [Robiginitomaculum antarcticum]
MTKIKTTMIARILVSLWDAFCAYVIMWLTIMGRYYVDGDIAPDQIAEKSAAVFALSCIIIWLMFSMSRAVWRYTSRDDILSLGRAVIVISLMTPLILFVLFDRANNLPRSAAFIAGPAFFIVAMASRALIMLTYQRNLGGLFRRSNGSRRAVILVGRSDRLHDYLRDKSRTPQGVSFYVASLIETSGQFKGRSIRGVPVMGTFEDIPREIESLTRGNNNVSPSLVLVDKNPDKEHLNKLVKIAAEAGVPLTRLERSPRERLTPLEAADLIGREERQLDDTAVRQFIENKRVMITGAGGTIGSELAKQVSRHKPARLILVELGEYNLYRVDKDISEYSVEYKSYMADITNSERMDEIFAAEHPDIVLHAAAMKHVPLSENNPVEAVNTNVFGSKIIIDMATKYATDSFTLISTDKAVKPSNIMGATKRVAEMMTLAAATQSPTLSACAVRFGNVLDSTGSVVPLFEEQISRGGPVTVTHRDATRFFMTVEEASSLVLQASALSSVQRKEMAAVYVLDMGQPVNIAQLARQLIRLRGYVPDRDILIDYTGLRAGEKLTEELTDIRESLISTYVDGVQRFTGKLVDPSSVLRRIDKLIAATHARDRPAMREAFKKLLPEYIPNGNLSGKIH